MDTPILEDRKVDAIQFVWDDASIARAPQAIGAEPGLRAVHDFFVGVSWQFLARFAAPAVLNRHGLHIEGNGFAFPSDLDPDQEPFDGVRLEDPIETIYIGNSAFDRLMSRFFNTVIEGAMLRQVPEVREDWWPEFVATARAVQARSGAAG